MCILNFFSNPAQNGFLLIPNLIFTFLIFCEGNTNREEPEVNFLRLQMWNLLRVAFETQFIVCCECLQIFMTYVFLSKWNSIRCLCLITRTPPLPMPIRAAPSPLFPPPPIAAGTTRYNYGIVVSDTGFYDNRHRPIDEPAWHPPLNSPDQE